MITIKELLHRYQSGESTPQKYILDSINTIRAISSEAKDSAWIAIATDVQISKQLKNLELLSKEKSMSQLPI